MKRILIDIGSSTIKVYSVQNERVLLLDSHSISFKNGFDPVRGISEDSKKELFKYIKEIQKKNKKVSIKIYATSIFRKFAVKTKKEFIKEFNNLTKLNFNIISQNEENKYLQLALAGKYMSKEPYILINIGGGSTELVVMKGKKAIERLNIDLGVGTILSKYPEINKSKSGTPIEIVIKYINKFLPTIKSKVRLAFYSGGELRYMKLAKYNLTKNTIFIDNDHPRIISFTDFQKRNKEIFSKVRLNELESLMPENPTWMHGARACSAIAETICKKYKIKIIVPSNSNLIDGVVRKEFNF